jgi:hypothetical protein
VLLPGYPRAAVFGSGPSLANNDAADVGYHHTQPGGSPYPDGSCFANADRQPYPNPDSNPNFDCYDHPHSLYATHIDFNSNPHSDPDTDADLISHTDTHPHDHPFHPRLHADGYQHRSVECTLAYG